MNVELKLTIHNRYSIVTLVFFTSYIVFEFPSTVIIRYLGPRNHLAGITVLWGAVMLGRCLLNEIVHKPLTVLQVWDSSQIGANLQHYESSWVF